MKRTLREEEEGKELPTLPLNIIMGVLSHLKLESVSVIFGLLRLCKEVKERSNELLPCLVKGWAERILAGDNASEEFYMMTGSRKEFSLTAEQTEQLLCEEEEKPSEDFAQNLFDYQIFILEREWIKKKFHVQRELIMEIHKEGKRQRQMKDLYYFDKNAQTLTPLLEYPGLLCIEMTMDRYDLKYAMIDIVHEMTKGLDEILSRYVRKGITSKKNPVLRSDFYELRKQGDKPFVLLPVNQNTHVSNLVIGDTHIFCAPYKSPDSVDELRENLYSCSHKYGKTSYQFHDRQQTLLRYLTGKSIHQSFLEKFHLS